MRRRTPRRAGLLVSLATSLLVTGLAGGAAPASAAPPAGTPDTLTYVALGDSYAAGQGGGNYLNSCLQSPASYPALLDAAPKIKLLSNLACSGATTADVIAQAQKLPRGTKLVTVTVGGNDLQVGAIAGACLLQPDPAVCTALIGNATHLLESGTLRNSLLETYGAIANAAPKAQIVVTAYPMLFPLTTSHPLEAQINTSTSVLNGIIASAVTELAAAGVNIELAPALLGSEYVHGYGSPLSELFHPTAAGYSVYAGAIQTVVD